jgi:hypothetical protein
MTVQTSRSISKHLLFLLTSLIWPLLAGAGVLGLLALVAVGLTGGSYGERALLFYGPVALGLLLVAALLRTAARKLAPELEASVER